MLLRPLKNKCRVVWHSHLCLAQKYYDLKKINVQWSGPLTRVSPTIITTSKKLMLSVWPSHLLLAQKYYDLEKINVEWSGPLTTVSPKIITTSKK
jgi:hypothetical protein